MEAPRQLRRSASSRIIGGVCGGLAEYLGLDPTVVRIVWIALTVLSMGFGGIVLYLLAWIIMPTSSTAERQAAGSVPMASALVGLVLIGGGVLLLLIMALPWGFIHPWPLHWDWCWPAVTLRFLLPFALVILGIALIVVGLSGRSPKGTTGEILTAGPTTTSSTAKEAEGEKPPVRRLYRSFRNKKIAGICGGLGDYFNVDPTVFRILWVLLLILFGTGILLYLVLWIVIPIESESVRSATS